MEKLISGAARLGLALAPEQVSQFQTYYQELMAWNSRINLTAIVEYEEVQVKHFLDSLTVAWALGGDSLDLRRPARAIDVGTGAGLPGLALKIAFPAMALTLLDSVSKKAAFLRHVVRRLGLEGVEVVVGRAETIARKDEYRQSFDLALSRGVAGLASLAELTLPFLRQGGLLVAQKSGQIGVEVEAARRAMEVLGGRLRQIRPVEVEGLEGRALILVEKVAPTPPGYPRRPGTPQRRPLKTG